MGTNFIVFIGSVALLALGIIALTSESWLFELVDIAKADTLITDPKINSFVTAAYLFIVIAVFAMILAFFGCCGAWKDSKCMLSTYFAMILVLFVLVIVGAIMGYNVSMSEVKRPLEQTMKKFKDTPNEDTDTTEEKTITKFWNTIQKSFRCCGTD